MPASPPTCRSSSRAPAPKRRGCASTRWAHPGAVSFVHQPSFPLLQALYRRARALVFAPVEDFGIVPVEAMASGTPVIANAVGGAAESVIDGKTGVHVHEWTRAELSDAVERASALSAADCVAAGR